MEKPLYESLYVFAGRREDGTFGIFRNRPGDTVNCYNTPEEAKKAMEERGNPQNTIVVDIGLLVDRTIPREENTLDASVKIKKD